MVPASHRTSAAVVLGGVAAVLLLPPPAFALDLIFVFDGLIGTFRGLEAGTATSSPPATVALNFASSSGSPKGLFETAPRCLLPDCGFISVNASGSTFIGPTVFHGHNGGWQLLISSVPQQDPGAIPWDLTGLLLYCPGFELAGDLEQCPAPGPGTEPRSGWLTPPPHGDPGDPGEPAVPGPAPFLGAAAAFGFSRKLRTRIRATPTGNSQTAAAPPGPRRAAG
jgi:hypothetical protein